MSKYLWPVHAFALQGYYIDVGASQLIIDGKIKVKPDVGVAEIEEKGVRFTDGSYLDADMIVLCTGTSLQRLSSRGLLSPPANNRVI